MMSVIIPPALLIILFLIEILYFKIADHYNIIDKPNSRSSHTAVTIRGGGIIFTVAAIAYFFSHEFQYPYFILGLFLISFISFLDDIITLNNKVRIVVHLVAVLLLLIEWNMNSVPLYFIPIAVVFIIGTINAYNFMDGINGITGIYSLVTILSLYYINNVTVEFVQSEMLIFFVLALLVFLFFNFRKKAKCFAGDVGSVSIAFIILFLIGSLIIQTQNFNYILLLLVYGLDAVITIGFRLIRRENIFEAHRSHFYQYLANEKRVPHLYVSLGYGLVQLLVNFALIKFLPGKNSYLLIIILCSTCAFIGLRWMVEGKAHLVKRR